jgi:hypothetical protein
VLETLERGTTQRKAEAWVLAAFALAVAIGCGWGLPGSDSWAADSISPRSCGLGAIVETYRPGHFHAYPPLQMLALTLLSLPWMALALARVGANVDALSLELIKPLYMTAIEATARAVTFAMALGVVGYTMLYWARAANRRVGVLAGIAVALDATLVYYAHTGNLDVPCLFWIVLTLVQAQRCAAGEPCERRLWLCAACAVLTKDQAAGALVLCIPLTIAVALARTPRPSAASSDRALRARRFLSGGLVAAGFYLVTSGALVNPRGFGRRLAFLFGPASRTWTPYPPGLRGMLAVTADATRAIPRFGSWPLAVAALAGVVIALWTPRTRDRVVLALPLVAAASFAAVFDLGARRSEERFLMPQAVLLFPYAALAFERLGAWRPRLAAIAGVVCVGPALLGVASMDATLLADPRYAAEALLANLPAGTRVEVYGGPVFLPRIPRRIDAVRPGVEPLADRQRIDGVDELVDPAMDPRPRDPQVIVLSTELSSEAVTEPPSRPLPAATIAYHDVASHRLLRGLYDGSLGYARIGTFRCQLPWPLECRSIHDSTAGSVWIYARAHRDRS